MAKSIKLSNDYYWDGEGLYNHGINNLGSVQAGGGSKTITIPANTRGVLFTIASNANQAGAFAIICNSSGVASYAQYVAASSIGITASANEITIQNNQSSGVVYLTYIGQNSSELTTS